MTVDANGDNVQGVSKQLDSECVLQYYLLSSTWRGLP